MKLRTVAAVLALAFGTVAAGSAGAQALHGFCSSAATCTDMGSNTPTSVNPPEFGFWAASGPATGTVRIDILVPDNVTLPASYTLSGPFLGAPVTANLFSST